MNMPEPMHHTSYEHASTVIRAAAKTVAERSMADAAKELRGDNETADVAVSVDGTWQKKGFNSTLGVITAISVDTGKVLDVSIMSKSCKGCTNMDSVKKTIQRNIVFGMPDTWKNAMRITKVRLQIWRKLGR